MQRRNFLKFAGVVGLSQSLLSTPAEAATWQKIGGTVTASKVRLPRTRTAARLLTIAVGTDFAAALRSDGLIFTCGSNATSKLVDGGALSVSRSTYQQTVGLSNANAVAAGDAHIVALRADGFIFTGGSNSVGQLGINSGTVGTNSFVQATGVSNAIAVSASGSSSLVLRSDGLVFGCGSNTFYQLGFTTTANRSTYAQVTGISNALDIKLSALTSLALRSDGLVFACGFNSFGNLGDGTNTDQSTFVQCTGISNAIAISVGALTHMAIRADGLVFACGINTSGQLGDGSLTSRTTFVQSTGISNAVSIAAGNGFTFALRSDGLLFSCGINAYGQLGDNGSSRSTFAQVSGISNVVAIVASVDFAMALRADGQIYSTGRNQMGQLGDNTTVGKSSFIQPIGI